MNPYTTEGFIVCIYIYIHTHAHTHTYIYIYTHIYPSYFRTLKNPHIYPSYFRTLKNPQKTTQRLSLAGSGASQGDKYQDPWGMP